MNRHRILFSMFLSIVLFFSVSVGVLAADVSDDDPQSNQNVTTEDDSGNSSVKSYIQDLLGLSSTLTYQSAFTGSTYTIPSMVKANGIDVSQYNGTIDWAAVAADGVDFAYIRAGFRGYGDAGTLNTDTSFVTNIKGAQAAGIKVGVYFYSQAITTAEAQAEAAYVMNLVSGYNIDLPIVIDFEYAADSSGFIGRLYKANLSTSAATAICIAFCDYISDEGYIPVVYADKSRLTSNLNASTIASDANIWLANYTTATSYTGAYSLWQYSNTGSVNGITSPSTGVDCDFSFVDLAKLGIPFDDVASGTWYLNAVAYAYKYHLFSGTTTTTFEPDTAMSRAMLVSVLYRLEGSPSVSGTTAFTDLSQSWYQNAVLWAYQNGIVSGTSATTFEPDTAITREQMAAILYRYSKTKGYDVSASGSFSRFSDSASVSGFATTAMSWAVGKGYISGNGDGTLCPKASATRAQVASILMRFCKDHQS